MTLNIAAVAAAALIATTPVAGQARQAQDGPPPLPVSPGQASAAPLGYRVGVGDIVQLIVFGQPEANARLRVRQDGTVEAPFLGALRVVGMTAEELADDMRRRFIAAGIYRAPQVVVEVVGFQSQTIRVIGFVNRPGIVTLDRQLRLSEVLAIVGGPRLDASDQVAITRTVDGKTETIRTSFKALAEDPATHDVAIQADDQIFVPEAEQYFLTGKANAPGGYRFREGMTVRQAIAAGGGVNEDGSESRFRVRRKGEDGASRVVRVRPDELIKPGDIIELRERIF